MKNFLQKLNFLKPKDGLQMPKASKFANPHTQWKMLLGIFSAVTLFLIAFSLYLLLEIKNDQIFQVSEKKSDTPTLLQDHLLNSVTESFDLKAKKTTDINEGFISFPDPSRP